MAQEIRFETVEDMIKYVVERPHRADIRWQLHSRQDEEWAVEEEDQRWEEKFNALVYPGQDNSEAYEEYQADRVNLYAQVPAKVTVTRWCLLECGESWHATTIGLNAGLGAQLASVWTIKTTKWSSFYVAMKIPGILKKLGHTDIGKQIKAAVEKEQETYARNRRNSTRRQIQDLAKQIVTLKTNHPEMVFPATIEELAEFADKYMEA